MYFLAQAAQDQGCELVVGQRSSPESGRNTRKISLLKEQKLDRQHVTVPVSSIPIIFLRDRYAEPAHTWSVSLSVAQLGPDIRQTGAQAVCGPAKDCEPAY